MYLPRFAHFRGSSAARCLWFRPHGLANGIDLRLPGGQVVHEPLVFINKLADDGQVIRQGLGLQLREDVFFAYQPLHEFVQKGQEVLELFEMVLQFFVSKIKVMPLVKSFLSLKKLLRFFTFAKPKRQPRPIWIEWWWSSAWWHWQHLDGIWPRCHVPI